MVPAKKAGMNRGFSKTYF